MSYPRRNQGGTAIIEFGFVLWPLIICILLVLVGGLTVVQHPILAYSAQRALTAAARIDQDVNVMSLSENQPVVCEGVSTGVPACGLLTADRYESIVLAAGKANPFFSAEKMQIIYTKEGDAISVKVKLSADSFFQMILGDAGQVSASAATVVWSRV